MFSQYQSLMQLIKAYGIAGKFIAFVLILSALEAASATIYPLFTQQLVDQLSAGGIAWEVIAVLSIILMGGAVISGLNFYVLGKFGESFIYHTRERIFKKIIRLPVSIIENGQAAEPANRLISDTEIIGSFVSEQVASLFSGVLTLVVSLAILFFIDAYLTLVLFGCVLVALILIFPISSKIHAISKAIQDVEAQTIGRLSEVFGAIRLVKACGAESQEVKLTSESFASLKDKGMKEIKVFSFLAPIASVSVFVSLLVILVVGSSRVVDGNITMGELIAFILYLFNIVMPMTQMSMFIASLNKAAGGAVRLHELESSIPEKIYGEALINKKMDLQFNNVRFSYDKTHEPLINIDALQIPQGKTTAIVGATGSGKSTVFSLITRFFPSKGISYGEQSINDINLESWRNHIAIVDQNAQVLAGDIRFNLTYGLKKPSTDEDCINALKAAHLWNDFIEKDGLFTLLGEKGINLSGGQRQRLAIARAILRSPEMILLDEATSALDAKTEKEITDALAEFATNKTCIVIAHRLNTVVDADQIVVLDQGQIVGKGDHESLLETSPHYRTLIEEQLKATKLVKDKISNKRIINDFSSQVV